MDEIQDIMQKDFKEKQIMTNKKSASWLLKTVGKHKGNIVLLLLLHTFVNGGAVCYALVMKKMVDCAVGKDKNGFFTGLLIFGMLMLILMLTRMAIRQIEEATRSGTENSLKKRLFRTLLNKDFGQVSAVHSEEWMNRITSDSAVCANGMTEILPGFTGMFVRFSGALVMMFLLQPQLAYILIPGGIVFVLITLMLRKYLKAHHKKVQEKDGAVRVYLQERISSMLILRTFGAEKEALCGAEKEFAEHKSARMRKAFISNLCNTGFSFAINGMYLLGIGYCGYGILNDTVSYGTLTAIIQLIGQLQAPLSGISGFVPRYYAMIASAERLMEAESYTDIQSDKVRSAEETKELYNTKIKGLAFDKVSFCYKKENNAEPVLDNVSFSVSKGDFIAVTGLSGCGKSTLLKLLMGVYAPLSGSVDVRLTNNEHIPINVMRRLFAYVPQGNYLMGGTIRDVITFGKNEVQSDSLEKAVKLACAEFINKLPKKLDTVLGEKGSGLSEGQMQRISIARALYTDAPVLILDEATSALDIDTEKQLLNNLKQLTDKTVFIVTHRPEALKICNKQFELSDKKVSFNKKEVQT
ncbi:MAG: ABC transporter ATP-binding protein [Ruminococcus sp.]|nr:ABC transporter ATP-binding protein [Ruminococcus sp.]